MGTPTEQEGTPGRGALQAGESVLLVDRKARRYLAVLTPGRETDIRGNRVPHDDLIGRDEGFRLPGRRGEQFVVVRPTLAQLVVEMPRFATVIYPKDLAQILVWADLRPGLRVVEAGVGSGALSIAVLRAIAPGGELVSYELREQAEVRARKNVALGTGAEGEAHVIRRADIYEGIAERDVDRLLLDVPEPFQVVPHAAEALRDGGVFMAYLPTILQVKETVDALHQSRAFALIETYESLLRPWHVARESVRPEHRMVGHSGFLVFARKVRGAGEVLEAAETGEDTVDEDAAGSEGDAP